MAVMADATRKAGYQVERSEGLALFVAHQGNSVRCKMEMLYNAYGQAPNRLDDIVAAHLSALAKLPPMPAPPSAAGFRAHLLPMLNQRSRLDALQRPELPAPLHRPFPGGLVVTYVIDQPQTMAYVNARWLEMAGAPGLTVDELHVLAIENLRTRPQGYEVHGVGDQRMIICKDLDGYTACRVLLPDLLDDWASKVNGRLLLGIPNRDFLVGFGDRDPQHVAAMARQVRIDTAKMPRPLTHSLLVWQDGRLREVQPLH